MMNDDEISKIYLTGLKYSEKKKNMKFKDGFDFVKKFYLESLNLDIGNAIDSLNEYQKCKRDKMETGDIAIYKSNNKILIGINFGGVLERVFIYYDETEQKVKMAELCQNIDDYPFQYGLKIK